MQWYFFNFECQFYLTLHHFLSLPGQLNSDIHVPDSNRKIFSDLVADLKKALKKSDQVGLIISLPFNKQ